MKKLISLAADYEQHLGIKTAKLPKSLQKIAAKEEKINKKLAKLQSDYEKVLKGPVIKVASIELPATYIICPDCAGQGKIAQASVDNFWVGKCASCNGNGLVKTADLTKCSAEEVEELANAEEEVKKLKSDKKTAKQAKKLKRAEEKLAKAKLRVEDPAAHKADKKKRKAQKKLTKAQRKLEKLKGSE